MDDKRVIFYLSDGTGITAETIGHTLLTQFAQIAFTTERIPFVDTREKACAAAARIKAAGEAAGVRPIVVNTIVNPDLSTLVASESGALMLDVFQRFLAPLEEELGTTRQSAVGRAHGMSDGIEYEARIHATNYALAHDDGVDVHYDDADLVMVGVSRSGKTPTCLFLALHFGIKAANYPLTQDDLESGELPHRLRAHRKKLFALTIDPVRLQQIRQVRRPDSRYSELAQCRWEVAQAEKLFRAERVPVLSTTHASIEEIASKVMQTLGINRQLF